MIKKIPLALTIIGFIGCLACIPLLVVGCTNNKVQDMTPKGKSFVNVDYYYEEKEHCYAVFVEKNTYFVPPKNFYLVEYSYWKDNTHIKNEYFVSTNELFVYRS